MDQAYQAKAPEPIPMGAEAFENTQDTAVYWLTGAGVLLNSQGTTLMVDPILSLLSQEPPLSEVEGTPQYVMPPISAQDVNRLDAVLYTHADADHLGDLTVSIFQKKGFKFHGTEYVKKRLLEIGVPEGQIVTHKIGEQFKIGHVEVQLTPADHPWQLEFPETQPYVYKPEDCCGYKFYTTDGVVWVPGDSRLLKEHLKYDDVDLLFMDFEDNSPKHHFGTEAALKVVNQLKDAQVIMYHWGTYYAPEKAWYAADPQTVIHRIENRKRFLEPHPGEKVQIKKK